jgi:hypothetical protein
MFLTHLWKCALRQRLANGPRRRRPATPRSFRPQLEELESRLVPSNTTVYTVTSTDDNPGAPPPSTYSGPGFTLRDAILGANATGGPAKIVFDIPLIDSQGRPVTSVSIAIKGALPTLVNDDTIIDGTSEPGWSGTPIVKIVGTNTNGIQGAGLTINANGCTIKGLDIEQFFASGVNVFGNSNILTDDEIQNNVGFGIALLDGASNNIIGGTTGPVGGFNNLIQLNGSGGVGIEGRGTSGNILEGNDIKGNISDGVLISEEASNNVIGGTATGAGNQIEHNGFNPQGLTRGFAGIELDNASGNVIQGNRIEGNSGDGVEIGNGSAKNTIGGTAPGAGNRIDSNGSTQGGSLLGWGVELTTTAGTGNTIEENSFSGNNAGGITLGGLPATGNANPPASPQPNNAQNAPVINSVTSDGTTTTISFTLSSAPNSNYRIEFFATDPSGQQSEVFLGSTTVTTDKHGQFKGTFTFTGTDPAFTATATDSAGDTSAFAEAVSDPVSNGHKKH